MSLDTLCKILNVVLGMLIMYVGEHAWARYKNWKRDGESPLPRLRLPQLSRRKTVWLAVVLVLVGSIGLGVQSHRTDIAVRDLTMQTQQCYREFAEAIQAARTISKTDKAVYRNTRDALIANDEAMLKWLTTLLSPPPEIAALPQQDQRRRDWNISVTQDFNKVMVNSQRIIGEARDQERKSDKELEANPLPAPTCGQVN